MKLSETLLESYAKKILGFSYEKTGNSFEAEDLAQEIMVQLILCINNDTEIEYLNSFVYTVCCYTWSKYLRRNKKHWNYAELEDVKDVADDTDIALEAENREMHKKLRKTVSTLARTQREIILMHYYENKTTAEISRILDMNDSTVRWYLGKTREELKERINMSENNLNLRPLSMCVGMDGFMESPENFRVIQNDLLGQNIAIACYGEPLSISEISEKLNVAAAYLERDIEHMVNMDYLKQIGKKYQTNFFIKTDKIMRAEVLYGYDNAKSYADRLYNAVMAKYDDIMAIDYYNKAEVNEDCFIWQLILRVAQEIFYEQADKIWKKYNITDRPIRKDGKYWIIANIRYDTMEGLDESQNHYMGYRMCNGYKDNNDDMGTIYQADTFFIALCGKNFRKICSDDRMLKFIHVIKAIVERNGEFNDYEKIMAAELIEEGYISVKNGKQVINVPVLTEEQMKELEKIIEDIKEDLGRDFFNEYITGFGEMMEKMIPDFLDKKIRNYHKYAVLAGFDAFGWLIKEAVEGGECKLKVPDTEMAKHALTMVMLKK